MTPAVDVEFFGGKKENPPNPDQAEDERSDFLFLPGSIQRLLVKGAHKGLCRHHIDNHRRIDGL